jgi:hypothetical protein
VFLDGLSLCLHWLDFAQMIVVLGRRNHILIETSFSSEKA